MYLYEVCYSGDKWLVVAETLSQAIIKWKKTVYEQAKIDDEPGQITCVGSVIV